MEAPVRSAAAAPTGRCVELARLAGLPDKPFRSAWQPPGGTLCFADQNTIAVVLEEDAPAGTSTLGMAYGLGHACDRDVHLLVPAGEDCNVAQRAAFLQHKVRVSGYDGSAVTAIPPPARSEIREAGVSPAYVRDSGADRENWELRAVVLAGGAGFGLVCGVGTDGPGRPVLGVDGAGDLHVIVAAAPDDGALVLRALDAWLWATGDGRASTPLPGLRNDCRVLLTIVLGDAVLSPYAPALLESLNRVEMRWRLAWRTGDGGEVAVADWWRLPSWLAPRQRPAPPRWPVRLTTALRQSAGAVLTDGSYWPSPAEAIHPGALPAYEHLRRRGLLHRAVLHVASSQAFAINLFGPLDASATGALLAALGMPVASAEPPLLEYSDPIDRLAEASTASPHLTQVDVLLRGTTAGGEPVAGLIEVKLTEPDFGECSAHQDPANDRRQVCRQDAPFGGDPGLCFQLRRRDPDHPPRRYAQVLDLPNHASRATTPDGGCPFRAANQQMRNVALAAAMREAGEIRRAVVALCAPAGYASIWRRWAEACEILAGVPGVTLGQLPAETVLNVTAHPEADLVRRRHLDPGLVTQADTG